MAGEEEERFNNNGAETKHGDDVERVIAETASFQCSVKEKQASEETASVQLDTAVTRKPVVNFCYYRKKKKFGRESNNAENNQVLLKKEEETVVKADDDVADSSVQIAAVPVSAPVSGGKRKTAEGASSVVASRKSDRCRKSTLVAMEAAQCEERGDGRKRKTISDRKKGISTSEKEENGGGYMKKEKNKAGSRKRKEIDENSENEMRFPDNKGYALRRNSASNIKHNNTTHGVDPKIEKNKDDIAEACPVCCGNCNCKGCLKSSKLIEAIKDKKATNKDHEVELSKYMLKILLPYLIRLDQEQMVEKEIEAKRQGLPLSELKIKVADSFNDERVFW
ncbi:hypothetical protein TSUD_371280 [Trifolium subterraneum]|uniref:Uncharacterized protein n=1 Tax=Trifolium subterraneum TaxID=3900 RepID=A0A2Z6PI96_TRISU|nr:hypothetical protein TSUD_371280 [Trifolium subterraneum]